MDKFVISKSKKRERISGSHTERSEETPASASGSETDTASSASTSTTTSTTRKRKNISIVWKYFKKSNDKRFAKCLSCGKEYKCSGNTSNLADHLKRFHYTNTDTLSSAQNPCSSSDPNISNPATTTFRSISPFFKRTLEYDSSSQRKKDLDKSLGMMIATDFQPFNIVNDIGFKSFVKLLDPKYILPSKSTLRDTVLKNLYSEGVTKLKEIIKNINFFAITTDCWTSIATESYISVTCHFIDENYDLKTAILAVKKMTTNHTSQNMADALIEVFEEWKIRNKIICIVTDNAANALKMCEILKIRNLPCFAHTLNLVVQDNLALGCLKEILKKCKDIVRFIKSSNIAADTFRKEQEVGGEDKIPYKLLQEVSTRWNSSLHMIKRIINTSDALNRTLLKVKKAPSPLTAEEITILKDIDMCLDIFEDATNKVSGTKYVTVSLIIPIAFGIYTNLNEIKNECMSEEGKALCSGLIESVKQRLFPYESRSLARISTILDPRYKKEGFRSEENSNQAANYLEQQMNVLMRQSVESQEKPDEPQPETNLPKKKSLFSFVKTKVEEKSKSVLADVIIRKRQYLERTNSPEDTDPLLFWKVNRELIPLPGPELSKKYLCIPASSTESERVFSTSGYIISDRRSRIKAKNVDMLVFLNKNQWIFT